MNGEIINNIKILGIGKNFFDLHWLSKKTLILFILLLPFQQTYKLFLEKDISFTKLLNYIDEGIGLIVVILIISFILLKHSSFKLWNYSFLRIFFAITTFATLSMFINKVPSIQGMFGIYDLVKNIFLIYLFSLLNWSEDELKGLIRGLIFIGIILSIFAIFFELKALLTGELIGVHPDKRLGLYRIESLVGPGNINYLGIYFVLLFYLAVDFIENKFIKLIISGLFLLTLFLTMSRIAWLGFAVVAFNKSRKFGFFLVSLLLIAVFLMSYYSKERYDPKVYYRTFTILESLRLFSENPIFGVGPGTFGGVSASVFESKYYDDWPEYFRALVLKIGGLDSFWAQIWAELGIIGILLYLSFFISIYKNLNNVLIKVKIYKKYNFLIKTLNTSKGYILAISLMALSTGLNKPFVVFTFFCIAGMLLSIGRKMQYA